MYLHLLFANYILHKYTKYNLVKFFYLQNSNMNTIQIPDKLLINLNILSKIQKNGKITRSNDGLISIETNRYFQFLKRFVKSDSRKQSLFEIKSIIDETRFLFISIISSKYMLTSNIISDEYKLGLNNLEILKLHLDNACYGLDNLKFTYNIDNTFTSELDVMILKSRSLVDDINNKINYYNLVCESVMKQDVSIF